MENRPWWLLPVDGRVHPIWWAPVFSLCIGAEYLTGPDFQVPLVFIIPLTIAAWYSGRRAALILAVTFPAARVVLWRSVWPDAQDMQTLLANAAVIGIMYVFLVLIFRRLAVHEHKLRREIRALEGLLPICAVCKSIRDPQGEWQRLERFIQDRSDAKFSHGLCPHCMNVYYDNLSSETLTMGVTAGSSTDRVMSVAGRQQ